MELFMNAELILWPVLVQITLTIVVFLLLGARKLKAVKARAVDLRKAALDNNAWPDDVRKVSNNIQNQFQLPVIFYVLCLAFLSTKSVSLTVVIFSWGFVISRVVHSYVHVGSNHVPVRSRTFMVGCICLILLCALLTIRLLGGGEA
ncbi:MAG: hypothetical protein ACI84K_002061 [Pseudohongiellaceae bacterium]|jgi:hypothetical protein